MLHGYRRDVLFPITVLSNIGPCTFSKGTGNKLFTEKGFAVIAKFLAMNEADFRGGRI